MNSRFAVATTLLAAQPDGWSNLGDWSDNVDYPSACRALAQRIGRAAHITPDARVLDLGCGAGASLRLWRDHFGVTRCDALDAQPALAADARRHTHGTVVSGMIPAALTHLPPDRCGPYDAIVAVDAAYHFGPLAGLLHALAPRLTATGTLAFTTFAWRRAPTGARAFAVRRVLAAAAIDPAAILPFADYPTLAAEAGLSATVTTLDAPVLTGFADFVARRRRELPLSARLTPGWAKIALTARACRALVASGLAHYVLISATRA